MLFADKEFIVKYEGGYKFVRHASGNGRWVIYNPLGHQVGESFENAFKAKEYLDEVLKGA